MVSKCYKRITATVLFTILVLSELTQTSPSVYADYDNLRDLYELLLRNEPLPSFPHYSHQMERKGGRSPSLRLRFGRRADPVWESLASEESHSASVPSSEMRGN